MDHVAFAWLVDSGAIGDDALAGLLPWLSGAETNRYQNFVRRERARQFVVGRVLLRQALGRLLGMPARAVNLVERTGSAPRLDLAGSTKVGLSISHSGAWVGCAVSKSTALGFDIEVIDPARDLAALAAQAFDADQNAWLVARPDADRVRDFYQLWSAREARFKLDSVAGPGMRADDPGMLDPPLYHPQLSVALCSAQPLARAELAVTCLLPSLLPSSLPDPVPPPR